MGLLKTQNINNSIDHMYLVLEFVLGVVRFSIFQDATTRLEEVVRKLPPRKFTAADSQRLLPDP